MAGATFLPVLLCVAATTLASTTAPTEAFLAPTASSTSAPHVPTTASPNEPTRTAATATPPLPSANSLVGPVPRHGALRVVGGKIVGEKSGAIVLLQGMSLFWSQWMPQFYNLDAVRWLMEDWNVTVIRAAMGVEHGGYLSNPAAELARVEAVVEAAIEVGVYVIIDWHDHNADNHTAEAVEFFTHMARNYGRFPHVIFEPFNEPVYQDWSATIKPYHEEVVAAIRAQGSESLVILGSRHWSQQLLEATRDPVPDANVAYAIHFYAGTHGQYLRDRVAAASDSGFAVFASEWGACEATGDGPLDWANVRAWFDLFEEHGIGSCNWAVSDKNESCSALVPGASGYGGWGSDELTESGRAVRAMIRGNDNDPPPRTAAPTSGAGGADGADDCSAVGEDCSLSRCCADASLTCYKKNQWWASCRPDCTPGEAYALDPPEYRTPWECDF